MAKIVMSLWNEKFIVKVYFDKACLDKRLIN